MRKQINKLSNLCIYILLLCILSSCYEGSDGCQDIRAVNYDLTADERCDDEPCCTYPVIEFRPDYAWDTLNFNLNTLYPLSGGDSIIVRYAHQVLSQIDIISSTGNSYQSIDTADFTRDNMYDLADIILLNFRAGNARSTPHIIIRDSISSIQFLQDIPSEINDFQNDFTDFSEIDQLVEDSLYDVNGDILSFNMEFDLINTDTISYIVSVSAQNFTKELLFNPVQSIGNGENFVVDLLVDLNKLFKDVIFDDIDSITLREHLIVNLEDYIELK